MKKHVSISALALAVTVPATSFAGVTGNIGFVTDYIFRGIFQAASSAYAGADYSGDKGFYAGTWWADVNQGTETDIYGGWTGGSDKVKFKAGYTGYRYLDNFDGNYDEINLGLYAGIFSLDVAVGQYDPSFPGIHEYTRSWDSGLYVHGGNAGSEDGPVLQGRILGW
ncbi:MAG TPA: TorF family putative porin [Gammaproteobacteria bacterium]|nr:TorF family putative porin [Gammaproteobacteria bacterium]